MCREPQVGRRDDAIRVRPSMATMATMATPRSRLSKNFSQLGGVGGVNQRTLPVDFFFNFSFRGWPWWPWWPRANHRADSPKTGWRIGVDTSRSTTHRVCESEHAFASCGGGRGEYLLTRRVWSAHGARRSSQRTQGGSCAVWGAQRLPKNWCRTTSGTPAWARA